VLLLMLLMLLLMVVVVSVHFVWRSQGSRDHAIATTVSIAGITTAVFRITLPIVGWMVESEAVLLLLRPRSGLTSDSEVDWHLVLDAAAVRVGSRSCCCGVVGRRGRCSAPITRRPCG